MRCWRRSGIARPFRLELSTATLALKLELQPTDNLQQLALRLIQAYHPLRFSILLVHRSFTVLFSEA